MLVVPHILFLSLYGGQFSIFRDDGDILPGCHRPQNVEQQCHRASGEFNRFFVIGIHHLHRQRLIFTGVAGKQLLRGTGNNRLAFTWGELSIGQHGHIMDFQEQIII
jgi:hypothetical protein